MKHTDLKSARERLGWDQQTLARRAGLNSSVVSRLEAGQTSDPSYSTVRKLETALSLEPGTLVFGEQPTEAA